MIITSIFGIASCASFYLGLYPYVRLMRGLPKICLNSGMLTNETSLFQYKLSKDQYLHIVELYSQNKSILTKFIRTNIPKFDNYPSKIDVIIDYNKTMINIPYNNAKNYLNKLYKYDISSDIYAENNINIILVEKQFKAGDLIYGYGKYKNDEIQLSHLSDSKFTIEHDILDPKNICTFGDRIMWIFFGFTDLLIAYICYPV